MGQDRHSLMNFRPWLLLLLLLLGAGGAGGGIFLVVSGEGKKLTEGKSALPGKILALLGSKPAAKAGVSLEAQGIAGAAEQPKSAAARAEDERKRRLAEKHLDDGFLPPELYQPDAKGAGGNTLFESTVGMTLTSDVRPHINKGLDNPDEAMKNGKLRFGPAATRRARRPDLPQLSDGGIARAVSVEQSGLRVKSKRAKEKKSKLPVQTYKKPEEATPPK